jgi:hypothetical protein
MSGDFKPEYLGYNFIWFFGVVEDRNDPLKLGRVRVRCYSWHTDDKKKIPTEALPWAQCVQPVTSAATSGIGRSPTGLVEGSWVFGFFMDGEDAQKPMVLGSLAGIPTELSNKEKGFNSPNGLYPDLLKEPDIPRAARGEKESNLSNKSAEDVGLITELKDRPTRDTHYETKILNKVNDVPEAVAPEVNSIENKGGVDYSSDFPKWSEPNPRYGGETPKEYSTKKRSVYPLNHVHISESGHVTEIDDTPGAERIHSFHKTGTFVETQHDGTRSTKVVGDDYEIVVENKKVFIQGSMTVTIVGDCKLKVEGNHYTEVGGDQFVTVRGDRITKIQGSDIKEVLTDQQTNIEGKKEERVAKDRTELIQGSHDETIQKNYTQKVTENAATVVAKDSSQIIRGSHILISIGKMNIATLDSIDIAASEKAKIHSEKEMAIDTTAGDLSIISGLTDDSKVINLNPSPKTPAV